PIHAGCTYRNVHVFGARQYDRSPGGTGTCARMAVLSAKGQLDLGQEVQVESVTGGVFRGRIVARESGGERAGVIREVTVADRSTGFHQFVIDPRDRLRRGLPAEW